MDKKQSGADVQTEEKSESLKLEDGRTLKVQLTLERGTGRKKPRYTYLLTLMEGEEEKAHFTSERSTCWYPPKLIEFVNEHNITTAMSPGKKRGDEFDLGKITTLIGDMSEILAKMQIK